MGKLLIVNLYEIDDGRKSHWERVKILDEDGNEIGQVVSELCGEGDVHRSMNFFQGLKLAKPGIYRVVIEAADRHEGPWETLAHRRLRAELRLHPLVRLDEKDPSAQKIKGPAVLTD